MRFETAGRITRAHPEIASFYIDNGLKFAFFTIAEGTAEIVSSDGSKTQLF